MGKIRHSREKIKNVMRCSVKDYPKLTYRQRNFRADTFVRLAESLERGELEDGVADRIAEFVDAYLYRKDLQYMTLEQLELLRAWEFIEEENLRELYPEEFEFEDDSEPWHIDPHSVPYWNAGRLVD